MFDRWCVKGFPDAVWIARRSADALPRGAERIDGGLAADQIDAWFQERGPSRDALVDIHELVVGPRAHGPVDDLRALVEHVREALREGRLLAYRLRVKLSGAAVQAGPELPPPEEATVEEKTWVAIELVDDQDPPKPVPYVKYRVELPNGSIREGILDDKGQAMIRDIDPGDCQVSFPELHAPDWKKL